MARYFREESFAEHPRYRRGRPESLIDIDTYVDISAAGRPLLDHNYRDEYKPERQLNEFPKADMTIRKGLEVPLIDAADYEHGPAGNADRTGLEASRLENELINQGRRNEVDDAVQEQMRTPQMFVNRPSEVTDLRADPSMRHAVPTMLGLAINQFGKTLQADGSLSKYSSRIVKRIVGSGVGQTDPTNPNAEANNNVRLRKVTEVHPVDPDTNEPMDWVSTSGERHSRWDSPSERELSEARRTMKNILRPKPRSPQFDALDKFESDRNKPYNPDDDPNSMRIPGL